MAKEEVAEQQGGQLGQQRANTDVNVWIQLSIAAVLTFLISIALYYAGKAGIGGLIGYLNGLINQRGPVQWLELLCFFVVVLFMILKSRIIRYQIQHIYDDTAQLSAMNMDNEDDLQLLRKRIHDEGLDEKSILLGRLDRGLALWLATKDVGRLV
ncbi:MAG TPA: hypothetical protein PK689_05955, partial [Kiritimatiellia bacterium]|nr:hypothetical protein [Kiritimatiellia bacterium]